VNALLFYHSPTQCIKMQTSISMWSQPQTEQEQRYYSKHSPKRKVYGIAQIALQFAHTAIALSAWIAIYSYSLRAVPSLSFAIIPLSLISLAVLHLIFKTSWETFWYDRLDNDPNTDSQPWLPLGIIAVLLITEVNGAQMFLKKSVAPVTQKDDTVVLSATSEEYARIDGQYRDEVNGITATFAPRLSAATARYDKEIAAWHRKLIISDNDASYKRQNIAQFEAKRAAAASKIELAKAEALQKALDRKTAALDHVNGRKTTLLASVDQHNQKELNRYDTEQQAAGAMAWIISAALVLGIAVLGYARVRINVKSGILPVRTFTDLDKHGTWIEQLGSALADAMKRRGTQLATWAHRILSPSGTIHTLDGNVITAPGSYNGGNELSTHRHASKQAANEPPADAQHYPISPELKSAHLSLTIALANFNDAATVDEKIDAWDAIYNLRCDYCSVGICSFITEARASVWFEKISFSEMINRYPFPPVAAKPIATPAQPSEHLPKAEETTLPIVNNTPPFKQTQLPEGAIAKEDGSVLFKQSRALFKQELDESGKVIGLRYLGPRSSGWTAIGFAQVKSFKNEYAKRAEKGEVSEAVDAGLTMWTWALGLFEQAEMATTETMNTINQ
jgi:hypothetical protein